MLIDFSKYDIGGLHNGDCLTEWFWLEFSVGIICFETAWKRCIPLWKYSCADVSCKFVASQKGANQKFGATKVKDSLRGTTARY